MRLFSDSRRLAFFSFHYQTKKRQKRVPGRTRINESCRIRITRRYRESVITCPCMTNAFRTVSIGRGDNEELRYLCDKRGDPGKTGVFFAESSDRFLTFSIFVRISTPLFRRRKRRKKTVHDRRSSLPLTLIFYFASLKSSLPMAPDECIYFGIFTRILCEHVGRRNGWISPL